ncbi:MAG: LEA type 2 family protein [Dokdonella sp.]|uniref:hypothetical protein n=1 Tax=Dokdonella sp. TaxID=2291710 RepID=UPI0025BED7D3|nr:hypothetical protein [Dokdonella sp.]MBZ0221719.1 LEA type 2 family protein [Dokdonella sp.]
MKSIAIVPAIALAALLTACSSGPTRKVHPSTASIQQIAVQADGHWRVTLRIQNYSTFAMHFSAIDAQLKIAGQQVAQVRFAPDIDIVGSNSDVVETTLPPPAGTTLVGNLDYTLEGTISTTNPDNTFKFTTTSHLSPAPGLAGTWR